jgi:hypothetical protein
MISPVGRASVPAKNISLAIFSEVLIDFFPYKEIGG